MAVFTVTMVHPDGDGWGQHLQAHLDYLEKILKEGKLKASGPLKGTTLRSGFLIIAAADRAAVEAIVAQDPFAIAQLIVELTITEWDPVFGAFYDISSKTLPGGLGPRT